MTLLNDFVGDRRRAISVNGKPCGIVQRDNHVLINESREVFVNGKPVEEPGRLSKTGDEHPGKGEVRRPERLLQDRAAG